MIIYICISTIFIILRKINNKADVCWKNTIINKDKIKQNIDLLIKNDYLIESIYFFLVNNKNEFTAEFCFRNKGIINDKNYFDSSYLIIHDFDNNIINKDVYNYIISRDNFMNEMSNIIKKYDLEISNHNLPGIYFFCNFNKNPLKLKDKRSLFDKIFKRNEIVTFGEFILYF